MKTLALLAMLLSLPAQAGGIYKRDLEKDENGNTVIVKHKKQKAEDRMTLCPDGTYVYGKCKLTPNGNYIGVPNSSED